MWRKVHLKKLSKAIMTKQAVFDVVIIGSGSAGFSAAEAAKSLGASVCIIEKEKLGGECPNYACIPTKALLKAAKVFHGAKHAREFGVELGNFSHDFSQVTKYRDEVVKAITGGGTLGKRYEGVFSKLGVEVKKGEAKFVDKNTVEVAGEEIQAKAFVIATGAKDRTPPIPGLSTTKYWTWKKAIQTNRLPKTLAVIGAGPVGCEIATYFASFGTRVVLIQAGPTILNREDADISRIATEQMEKLGVDIRVSTKTLEVIDAHGGVVGLRIESGGAEQTLAVEQIVLATGKQSNIDGLDLEKADVEVTDQGDISVSKEQQTNRKNVFAAGDVSGGLRFTHTAHHEGYVAGQNAAMIAKKKRTPLVKADLRVVPRVTFTNPEVASVGMTEQEVEKKFKSVLVGTYQVGSLGRAVTENKRVGLIKIVAHPKTRKVLGGHMIGERAGEVIHEVALALHLNASIDKLASMVHAFPTFSEGVKAAAASAHIKE
jgi:dihydrolipoamide dehydrogenase